MPTRKFARPIRRGYFALLLCCLFSACQTTGPVAPHLEQDSILAVDLQKTLLARQSDLRDIKSFLRTTVVGPSRKSTFNQVLLIREQDSIRMDTLGMFGQTLGIFIHDPEKTLLYNPKRRETLAGEQVWDAMERTLGMRFDFRNYVGVFVGNIPRLKNLRITDARLGPNKKVYFLKTFDSQTREKVELEIDAWTLLPLAINRVTGGHGSYRVQWEDYRKVAEMNFPHRLVISFPGREESVILQYQNPVINVGLPPDAFEFTPPAKQSSKADLSFLK